MSSVVLKSSHRLGALRAGLFFLLFAAAWGVGGVRPADAQGCVAARMDAPSIGALGQEAGEDSRWQLTTTWRYFESDRHFRGSHEETNRRKEGSEVINTVNQLTIGITYYIDDRWNLTLDIPWLMADRSSPIRDEDRVVVDRSVTHATGIGDMTFTARRWMLDPETHHRGNLALGFGIKLPTGEKSVHDSRTRLEDGEYVTTVETVDQSIQPGDGGIGALFELQGFLSSPGGHALFYGQLSYLFNPEETDHVLTYRSREQEKYMSIADQYLVRVGSAFTGPGWHGITLGLGARWEGVPVRDVFGGSDWFRRPGYAISVEPWISWVHGRHALTVTAPVAIERNRQRSVPDLQAGGGRHGDAAFADYSIIASYSYRFGHRGGHVHGHECAAPSGSAVH